MLRIALTTGLASLFVIGLTTLTGCPPPAAGEGEGEGEGAAGEGEGEGAGEGEGEGEGVGEGEGEGGEGEGEGEGATTCQEECQVDDDCKFHGGTTSNFTCVNHVCTAPAGTPQCSGAHADNECVAINSGWSQVDTNNDFIPDANCDATHACGVGQSVCVDQGDQTGRCAADKTLDRAGDCTSGGLVNQVDVNVTDIAGASHVVCAQPGAADSTCDGASGFCKNPCAADADCLTGQKCRTADGVCVACLQDADCSAGTLNTCIDQTFCGCAADGDCTGNAAGGFCIVADGVCGCANDNDCSSQAGGGAHSGDICFTGVCGCNTASTDCTGTPEFNNTTYVCQ